MCLLFEYTPPNALGWGGGVRANLSNIELIGLWCTGYLFTQILSS